MERDTPETSFMERLVHAFHVCGTKQRTPSQIEMY